MSIDELQMQLKPYHYQVHCNPQNHQVQIVTAKANRLIAQIDGQKRYWVHVFQPIESYVLRCCILHFAATPIRERFKDAQLMVQLSRTDLNLLRHLPVGAITNKNRWQITMPELRALARLLKQFDLQRLQNLDNQ